MRNSAELTIDVVNKVKHEEYTQFEDSIFRGQYRKACTCLSKIIKENREYDRKKDTEIYNVISFLGGRGTGKTSAMFSFADFLDHYEKIDKENGWEHLPEWEKPEGEKLSFLVLDSIDASMLAREGSESVLDCILAQIWDYYAKEFRVEPLWMREEETLKRKEIEKSFSDLKRDYDHYFRRHDDGEISTIQQLHELAGGLNLRKTLQKFVTDFLRFSANSREGYLVIIIDDVDMAGRNSFSNLEQMHLFMNIPGVILLLSADMRRLRQICGKYFIDTYLSKRATEYYEIGDERAKEEFANDYIDKIIAANMRVNMPDIYEINLDIKNQMFPKTRECKAQDFILETLYQNGIAFDCTGRRHHFLEERTLRNIVNLSYEMREIKSESDTDTRRELARNWLGQSLRERLSERIQNSNQRDSADKMFHVEEKDLNQYIIGKLNGELGNNENMDDSYRLGEVFSYCSVLENREYENKDFVNFILAYYTKIFSEMKDESIFDIFYQGSLWGELTRTVFLDMDFYSGGELYNQLERLKLTIEISEENMQTLRGFCKDKTKDHSANIKGFAEELLKKQKEDIIVFQCMLAFFPVSIFAQVEADEIFEGYLAFPGTGEEIDPGGSSEKSHMVEHAQIVIRLNSRLESEFCIDAPLITVEGWEKVYQTFEEQFLQLMQLKFEELISQLKLEEEIEANGKELVREITNCDVKEIFLAGQINDWNKSHADLAYLLPLKNVEFVYHMGKAVEQEQLVFSDIRAFDAVKRIFQKIDEKLEESQKLYHGYEIYVAAYREHPILNLIQDDEYERAFREYFRKFIEEPVVPELAMG